jgi:transposase
VLLAQLEKMGVAALLDAHFVVHSNWQGLSLGWVSNLWLTHLLSQADQRLNQVQAWAARCLQTLRTLTAQPVRALDLADDRLAGVLLALSDDAAWASFEAALTRQLLRVYDLRPQRVRLDTTSASGYWHVSEDGLFQLGHSKDHRPDLPQLKVMLATLDPLGLAIATEVLGGQSAADPAYLPCMARVRATLEQPGLLYIGDCKMAALLTRAHTVRAQDYYLCPLSAVQVPLAEVRALLDPAETNHTPLHEVVRRTSTGELVVVAEGYELVVPQQAVVDGAGVAWDERRLLVHSWAAAHAAEAALHHRLQRRRPCWPNCPNAAGANRA